ncbi:MAG: S-layer homology domain-containing protein, partial [Candidatus Gracilibacteria bacterium]
MKKLLQILGGGCGGGCKKILGVFVATVMLLGVLPTTYAALFPNTRDILEFTQSGTGTTNWVLSEADNQYLLDHDITPFFYRTGPTVANTDEYLYGYGYGYFSDSDGLVNSDGYGYGYGFGYGYDYFSENVVSWAVTGETTKFGEGMGSSYGTLQFAPSLNTDGNQEVTVSGAMTFPTSEDSEVTGGGVNVPDGVKLQGPAGWTGQLDISAVDGANGVSGITGAVTIEIETGGFDISLTAPVVVKIPSTTFADASSPLVKIVTAGNPTGFDADPCTTGSGGQYDGDGKDEPTNYTLVINAVGVDPGAAAHCYTYDENFVYVATTHFSNFAAGSESAASSADTTGGSSGGTVKKQLAEGDVINVLYGENVTDFSDLATLKETSWQYAVIQQMLDLGLFKGKTVDNGENIFDMNGNMTRGMAATVICRYMGCDAEAVVTVSPFTDVPKTSYYAASVAYLKAQGVVEGKTATTFDPSGTVT